MKEGHGPSFGDSTGPSFGDSTYGDYDNNPMETTPHSPEAQALSGSHAGMQLKPARELILKPDVQVKVA